MKHLAVVGCGRVLERYYLPVLQGSADWLLVAAIDPQPDRRRWIAARTAGVAVHGELAEIPHNIRVDAVLITAPPESHCALAEQALRRGAHVFIEKPMAPRRAEAASLLRLADDCERQIWVGFNRRFRPSYSALRQRLAQLSTERIVSIRYDLCSDVRDWRPISSYLGVDDRGGGVLDDIASHQLDLVPWLLGRPVDEISASPTPGTPSGTTCSIGLRFAGGLEAWCHAGHRGPSAERLEIKLDRGALLATRGGMTNTGKLPIAVARRIAGWRDNSVGIAHQLMRLPSATIHSFRRQLAEWAEALRSGHSAIAADGTAGVRCVCLVEACRESLAAGGAWVRPQQPMGA